MLSRVLEQRLKLRQHLTKSPWSRKEKGEHSNLHSDTDETEEEGEGWCGPGGDLQLTLCSGGGHSRVQGRTGGCLGMRELLRSSVEVLGMSTLGVTEKVVLNDGSMFVAKRFQKASLGRSEFARKVERVAAISGRCDYLVPLRAYLYSKRTKLVLCDYYPMGSLADLLAGARERGHTPLDWSQRAKIILHVARALSYIHSQPTTDDTKRLRTNIHGNIKPSNVFVAIDFSARLSDYAFTQLADAEEVPAGGRSLKLSLPVLSRDVSGKSLSQKADVYNFGAMVIDVLGGTKMLHQIHCIVERMEDIRAGKVDFFEYFVEGEPKMQALRMLEVALACMNLSPEARPTADNILQVLADALKAGGV